MKYVYIKNNISGNFIEFSRPFDEKLFNNIGNSFEDYVKGKWVLLNDEQVEFHKRHRRASVHDVWYMIEPEQN